MSRLGWLRLAGALIYLFVSLCVIVDPRYRDLPVATVAIYAVGFMLVALAGQKRVIDAGDRLIGWLVLASGLIVLAREGTANDAAWVWAATGLGVALGGGRGCGAAAGGGAGAGGGGAGGSGAFGGDGVGGDIGHARAAVVDGAAVAQAFQVLVGGSEGHGGDLRRAGAATGGVTAGGAAIGASAVGWVKAGG